MPRLLRHTLISLRDLGFAAAPFVVLALALLAGAYYVLDPTPPRRVVLATGPEQSDYAEFGKRYASLLRRHGIEVVLKNTQGSSENRRLLQDPGQSVDLAFVRGGSSEATRAVDEEAKGLPLVSLGSLYAEPLWLFYREAAARAAHGQPAITRLAQLRGWRVNVGARGSGMAGLFGKVLQANALERSDLHASREDLTPAVIELLAGRLDALVLGAAPESPMVQMLLGAPGIRLFEFDQADAYARRLPYLRAVRLPRGVADIGRDLPARDLPLLAATITLAARADTHPALLQLFVQATQEVHGGASWLAPAGEFPSPKYTELPLAKEAERFYRNGPPLLQRYLPFWLANLIERMWVALLSIIAVLIPLGRIVPPLYEFRIRSRIFRWYRELREIEDALREDALPLDALRAQLAKLESKAEHINVPLSYADQLYALRSHIQLVRGRLHASN